MSTNSLSLPMINNACQKEEETEKQKEKGKKKHLEKKVEYICL